MKLKKRERIILYFCIAAISLFIIERFFVILNRQTFTLNNNIRLAESRLKRYLKIQQTKDKILSDYERSQPYLKLAGVGEKKVIADLLSEIERIAHASGSSVINLNPKTKPQESKTHKEYNADFRLEGSFSQLLSFLSNIQDSKMLIKLDKLSIISKDERSDTLRIDGTVSLAVPF